MGCERNGIVELTRRAASACNFIFCVSYALNLGNASSMNVNGTRLCDTLILPTYITSKNCELLGDMSGMVRFEVLVLADTVDVILLPPANASDE